MKKKKLIIAGILILALIPLSIQLLSWTWDCYSLPGNCGGLSSCTGDSMEEVGGCTFRCRTGSTYTEWKICFQYPPWY